jgi:cell division protein FtsL
MSIDVEYAIKKDVRNNPIVRDVDRRQRRELLRTLVLGSLVVGMLLFSGWQHYQVIDEGYQVEALLKDRAEAEALNRRLRLEVDALRRPELIERRAIEELHMVYPTSAETLHIERVTTAAPDRAVVAQVR